MFKPKTFRTIKEYDTIEVVKNIDEILHMDMEDKYFKLQIDEGVVKVRFDDFIMYYYFKKINDLKIILEVYSYSRMSYAFSNFIHGYLNVNNGRVDIQVETCTENKEEVSSSVICFIRVISYMNILKEKKKIIFKNITQKKQTKQNKVSGTSTKKTVQILSEEEPIYIYTGQKEAIKSFRNYLRHTETWGVLGHVRHYKSGKTVWIKPYTKGKGEKDKKTYVIK